MEIQGKLIDLSDTTQVTDTFRKREFVVEYADNPQYPEFVKFECIQDRCDLLNNFQVGQELTVSFNLKGRKWVDPQGNTKYFNSLQAWRIQPAAAEAPASAPHPAADAPTSAPASSSGNGGDLLSASDEEDDLPF
ncbi:DUF3127 domain-containing protein [Tunicatimonas pelagia]|uniref:DUF3127 domain-containing protein n=1 Tax=Tunicatimonas pelagia TaxID=931531 RepID=UPI00266681E1|nr:DUF3127 domain-containing protein [Tunicatimonas pelagia]WKN42522.1 DUF3127 domain-containing protein [Tunicatimonas pelagia]